MLLFTLHELSLLLRCTALTLSPSLSGSHSLNHWSSVFISYHVLNIIDSSGLRLESSEGFVVAVPNYIY